ncbi:shikimate dehydrogenase [Campylobacter peloridis]|uniref:shikimate dehydrogenase n=1 Tax=Campylobacter peloridis TaxID=488546 RepID=UPI001C738B17|nr:shikimate dehydrogenase [Campylobacter peloridis]MBX1886032.1 shikimate dehydrogenase [Campylobacter peloridis]
MRIFSVIGNPIVHSKSPRMHNNAIALFNENAVYTRYLLQDGKNLKKILLSFDGANITIPFKEIAREIADFKDESVIKIGSANTLVVKNGLVYAYNTDYLGFLKAIEKFINVKSALILGAGGTAKALVYALENKNIELLVANRSSYRFKDFFNYKCCLYENIPLHRQFDLVINTTSAGLNDENLPCSKFILEDIFKKSSFAFDVIYGKETPFLKLARENNLQVKDGTDMLLWQGVYAFEIFFNQHDQKKIYKAMHEALYMY